MLLGHRTILLIFASSRWASFGVLLLSLPMFLFAGCQHARRVPEPGAKTDRQIELTIRSQYDIPADYGVTFGRSRVSDVAGYDELPVVFSHGDKRVDFSFLLSRDRRWLARRQRFDLHQSLAGGIDIAGRPIRGNPDAKVTVVVYDDLQCPFCSRFSEKVVPEIIHRYNGSVRVIFKDYPISEIHNWSTHAAVDANCLARQDPSGYWRYVDHIHARYQEFKTGPKNLASTLKRLDELALLDSSADKTGMFELRACIAAQDEADIKRSMEEAERLNVQSTPTIFIDGERIVGLTPDSWIWAAIDRSMAADKQSSTSP